MEVSEITYLIIFGTIAFLIFIVFIGMVMIRHYKKNKEYFEKTMLLKQDFERILLQSRLEIQEQTFDTISQEIHDNVGQLISLAKVQLSLLEQEEKTDKDLLADIKKNLSHALNDLRDIAKSLNGARIQQLTLPQIIDEELQRIDRSGIIQCRLTITGTEQSVSDPKKAILFRIVQECLQNILKHARANRINADIRYEEQNLQIRISDDGLGFNIEDEASISTGLGLSNIKIRMALLNGETIINTVVNGGTAITLKIPYE
ncbi:hypothetical protein HGH93_12165 [Chitinophaga polysaccharea]|uniref:sensor histidine kinase n=1 Tax=Chitinophaga polysaccharea TaxID=1293035 RepID=UPI001455658B|nr:ATP-binding protein [Chitinophaga polysaccharea]NLR58862.1 hypothetical protein [Chitinophaga polysaccharea]